MTIMKNRFVSNLSRDIRTMETNVSIRQNKIFCLDYFKEEIIIPKQIIPN